MYTLRIYIKAEREIKNISRLHQKTIFAALIEIKENPFIGKPLTLQLTGHYTYKVGLYRIVYKINKKDKIVSIVTAGHRSTVYE